MFGFEFRVLGLELGDPGLRSEVQGVCRSDVVAVKAA